jgi:hypothetical protein
MLSFYKNQKSQGVAFRNTSFKKAKFYPAVDLLYFDSVTILDFKFYAS